VKDEERGNLSKIGALTRLENRDKAKKSPFATSCSTRTGIMPANVQHRVAVVGASYYRGSYEGSAATYGSTSESVGGLRRPKSSREDSRFTGTWVMTRSSTGAPTCDRGGNRYDRGLAVDRGRRHSGPLHTLTVSNTEVEIWQCDQLLNDTRPFQKSVVHGEAFWKLLIPCH
jgi:hypothetical protein